MNVEDVLKFFEDNNYAKFIDVDTGKSLLKTIKETKSKQKSDFDMWLEKQDKETQLSHKMGEI